MLNDTNWNLANRDRYAFTICSGSVNWNKNGPPRQYPSLLNSTDDLFKYFNAGKLGNDHYAEDVAPNITGLVYVIEDNQTRTDAQGNTNPQAPLLTQQYNYIDVRIDSAQNVRWGAWSGRYQPNAPAHVQTLYYPPSVYDISALWSN